jgi:threonine dehydrogenase-like Zn-dependent dehydrogenase
MTIAGRLDQYRRADTPLPERNRLWPLYGAGFENLGLDGQPIEVETPAFGPGELLVRHDAVGLCFSDIKIIRLGEEHPRIYRTMKENPVVQGHEVSMTVVGVGENLHDQYAVGDRFIIQADIYAGGVNLAYGYEIQGGLSQYNVIDQRVLNGDDGNYLISVQPDTGYAESALTEPWACVIAAYELKYRTGLKAGGTTWIIGTANQRIGESANDRSRITSHESRYTISSGFNEASHPARLLLMDVPADFAAWLRTRAETLGVEVLDLPSPIDGRGGACAARGGGEGGVDDIVVLGPDPDLIEAVSPHLADFGIMAIVAGEPLPRKVAVDVGRVHYNRWVTVGGTGPDIAQAYSRVPVRSTLRPGGAAWFVGAGGPMGRMHVQRAIQIADHPATIVCTDISDLRLNDLRESFAAEARAKEITFICANPMQKDTYAAEMVPFKQAGFDDVIVLAPVPAVIAEAATYLAPEGVMNVFAGVARGTMVELDLSDAYLKDTRIIGHSASSIDDLRLMLHQAETGVLSPNRSVAAVGSLDAAKEGLQAVQDTIYPGKIVIYPNIKDFPLTAVPDLKDNLPSVYAKLKDGREWTVEAEEEFLRLMLP